MKEESHSSITLFGKPYDLVISDYDHMQGNMGSTTSSRCVIHMDGTLPPAQFSETFLHELVHVVSDELALSLPEESVRRLSVGLFSCGVKPPEVRGVHK